MQEAARLQAVIEILALTQASARPAEQTIERYCRARRYMGAKDRRRVSELAFAVLRSRARLAWWHDQVDDGEAGADPEPRFSVLAYLCLVEGASLDVLDGWCGSSPYAPPPLIDGERAVLAKLAGRELTTASQEVAVRCEVPAWLWPRLEAAFGPETEAEAQALSHPAQVQLRVNRLKCDRREAQEALAREGIESKPTPYSPLGLAVAGRRRVTATQAYRQGWIEPQDEAAQIAALLCDVAPGQAVLDLCAGGGGKALALAAQLGPGLARGDGRLVAFDIDAKRLAAARPRLERAAVTGVELSSEPDFLKGQTARFDRVLVDAPCSGTGRWRRSPDARWRLTEDALKRDLAVQAELLCQGGELVRPGGRLIYATCSLLPEENQAQVNAFLATAPAYRQVPVADVWHKLFDGPYPNQDQFQNPGLQLTPHRHETDGFFVAILERQKA